MARNPHDPESALQVARLDIDKLLEQMATGENDPPNTEWHAIGEAAERLSDLIQSVLVDDDAPECVADFAECERPIMLGQRGMGRF